jgi:excisionase family DNA binding protein
MAAIAVVSVVLLFAMEPLVDVDGAARILGLKVSRIYSLAESRDPHTRLPAVRIGRLLRFRPEDLRDYVAARAEEVSR